MGYDPKRGHSSGGGTKILLAVLAVVFLLVLLPVGLLVIGWWGFSHSRTERPYAAQAVTAVEFPPTMPVDSATSELEGRLKAAQLVANPADRQQALVELAKEAAGKGSVDVAMKAAAEINDPRLRQQTFAELVLKVARAGIGHRVEQMLGEIHEPALRDSTAAEAAVLLARAGSHEQAIRVAQRIHDPAERDKVLLTIARGGEADAAAAPSD